MNILLYNLELQNSAYFLNSLIELGVIKDLQEAINKNIHVDMGNGFTTCEGKEFFCVVLCDKRQWMSMRKHCDGKVSTIFELEEKEPLL